MYVIKTEDTYEDFSNDKEMFDFRNYLKSKQYNDSNKLVIATMKDETTGVVIQEFVGLKPKMYSLLIDNNSEHKKAKGVNRNVATISHNEYKDALLNNKCLSYSMNRIQRKDDKIGTYEINKISLSCLDDKYISKTTDMMDQPLVIRLNHKKTVTVII